MAKRLLITGGCGFIGTNLADYFSERGWVVTLLDNLSRRGAIENLRWLQERHPEMRFVHADIRNDLQALEQAVTNTDAILHFASQVAVTTSWQNPQEDFEINAVGTLNILEVIRRHKVNPAFLYASTNKVYGGMEDIEVEQTGDRYLYKQLPQGIPESRLLDFHSPYGCSKGTSDQYVRDYARMYGLNTVVLRQSCIYGPRQYGITDQGWVAWFMVAAGGVQPLTVYGDGKQTRDVLYITDLARAYEAALTHLPQVRGQIFNIGGGAGNVLSVLELINYLESELGHSITYTFADWRPGDQPCYISDIRKAKALLNWEPQVHTEEGLHNLLVWVKEHLDEFRQIGILPTTMPAGVKMPATVG